LFRTDHVPGPEARLLIADFIERKGARGRPRTPAYRTTNAEANLNDSAALYRYYRKTMTLDAAIEAVAQEKNGAHNRAGLFLA
jgi:hypothetical protein